MYQTRAGRIAGPNLAALGHAANPLHAQQHLSYQRSREQYKPTPLALLRCLYLYYYPTYDEKNSSAK